METARKASANVTFEADERRTEHIYGSFTRRCMSSEIQLASEAEMLCTIRTRQSRFWCADLVRLENCGYAVL